MIPLRDNIPLKIVPIVTRAMVVICVLVFLWQLGQGRIGFGLLPYSFGVIPAILVGDYKAFAWEDVEPGAYMDPDYLKDFETRGEAVRVQKGSQNAVAVKVIPGA